MKTDRLHRGWQIPNRLEPAFAVVYEIREWIDALPISDSAKYFTYAALEELVSNKIKYGFAAADDRYIDVRIEVENEAVLMEFLDDGNEFDPTAHPAADLRQNLDDGIDGGLGIELVRRICGEMTYRRENGFNRIELRVDILEATTGE